MTLDIIALLEGGSTLTALGAIVYLAYKLVSYADARDHLRDVLATKDTLIDQAQQERDGLEAQLDATSAQLRTERDLRAVAESQRNNAYQQVRDHVVQRIQASGIADASRLVGDLLAAPLSGLSPQLPAVPAGTTADGRGPAADVQPAAAAPADRDAGGHAAR